MSKNYEDILSPGRRYRRYQHEYNATFAADPNPENRRFDEMAPPDSVQWKRLEVFRGNDKDAYDAWRSNNDPLFKPTDKEKAMWEANAKNGWWVSRDRRDQLMSHHPLAYNKWLDMSPEKRFSEQAQRWFEKAEAKYGAGYDQWAKTAGKNAVSKETYVAGLTAVAYEQSIASRARQAQRTHTSQQAMASQADQAQAPTQTTPRSRISVANFEIGPIAKEMEGMSIDQLGQVKQRAEAAHQSLGQGTVAEGVAKHEAIANYQRARTQVRVQEMELSEVRQRTRGQVQ